MFSLDLFFEFVINYMIYTLGVIDDRFEHLVPVNVL